MRPPLTGLLLQPREARVGLAEALQGQLWTLSRSPGAAGHKPGSSSRPMRGSEGILTCRQQEPVPSPLSCQETWDRRLPLPSPHPASCPWWVLYVIPVSVPRCPERKLVAMALPPGAMSSVWTKNQVPWPMRRLPLPPQAVHTHIHTLTHTLLQISIIHSANKQKIRLQDQMLRNYPQVLKDIDLLCINYRVCFVKPKNTEVGSLSLLQGNLPTQELNRSLLHCRGVFTSWATQEAPHMTTYIYNSLF